MKTRITIIDSNDEQFTRDWYLKTKHLVFVGDSNYHAGGVQFALRKEPRLPSRVFASVKGEPDSWYEVAHLDDKTVLTQE